MTEHQSSETPSERIATNEGYRDTAETRAYQEHEAEPGKPDPDKDPKPPTGNESGD